MDAVIGTILLHFCPEVRRMVHFLPVAKFVDHHIVLHFLGHKHQQAVEIQIALDAAAAPSGTLAADGDAAIGNSHLICKTGYLFRKDF